MSRKNKKFAKKIFLVFLKTPRNGSSYRITLCQSYQYLHFYFNRSTKGIVTYFSCFSIYLCQPVAIILCGTWLAPWSGHVRSARLVLHEKICESNYSSCNMAISCSSFCLNPFLILHWSHCQPLIQWDGSFLAGFNSKRYYFILCFLIWIFLVMV